MINARRDILQTETTVNEILNFVRVKELTEEGRYLGEIVDIKPSGNGYQVTVRPREIEDETVTYGSIKGWIKNEFSDGDITSHFLEVFDHPQNIRDVIGKTSLVEVKCRESNTGEIFMNVVDFMAAE